MKQFKYNNKEYNLKSSWDDVTLEDFNSLKQDTSLKHQLSILCGLTHKEIVDMPASIMASIMNELNYFWNEDIKGTDEIYITIDEVKYLIDFSDMSLGQWVDCEELIKQGVEQNLHLIIAILAKPITLKYSEYDYPSIAKKILKCSIREVMNIVNFFLYIKNLLEQVIQVSTTQPQTMEIQ